MAAVATNSNNSNSSEVEYVVRTETDVRVARAQFKFGASNVPMYDGAKVCTNYVVYSTHGDRMAVINADAVIVYDGTGSYIVSQVSRCGIQAVDFSPNGRYLVSWEKMPKLKESASEAEHGNLIVWDIDPNNNSNNNNNNNNKNTTATSDATVQARYFLKDYTIQSWPSIQWTPNGMFYLRRVTNTVMMYDGARPSQQPMAKLHAPGVAAFAVAPGSEICRVAVFIPDKNAAPAQVRVFDYPELTVCLATKSFYKAEDVDLYWNPLGTAVLIQTRTDVDTTGKTYYGETGLHLLHALGSFSCTVPFTQAGPVQGCGWHPQGKYFLAIQGKQPATTTVFSVDQCTPTFSFGAGPHNVVRFSPHGRFLCLGGFGNLAGHMDFWDYNKKKKIGACQDRDGAKSFEWAPDGRAFVTAVLRPWRRVDNGYRVWSYAGDLLHEERIETLYQVTFRPPIAPDVYPDRPQSPRLKDKRLIAVRREAEAATKPQAYVPPSMRNRVGAARAPKQLLGASSRLSAGPKKFSKAEQAALAPTIESSDARQTAAAAAESDEEIDEETAAAMAANGGSVGAGTGTSVAAKRRQRKKRQEEKLRAEEEANRVAVEMEKQRRLAGMSDDERRKKRMKAINKKLRQIEGIIKRRDDDGDTLDADALAKVATHESLRAELALLEGK